MAPDFRTRTPASALRIAASNADATARAGIGNCGRESIEMTVDTKSRHRTKAGGNIFLELGFSRKEAKRLLAYADAQIDESIRLKRQLMDEIAQRYTRPRSHACSVSAAAGQRIRRWKWSPDFPSHGACSLGIGS
jgi:hypothetical protein